MKTIVVTRRPDGASPDWVRDAWIGVELPTSQDVPRSWRYIPDQTAKLSYVARIIAMLRGQSVRMSGWVVNGAIALERLAEVSPEAARWYRENAPHLAVNGMSMLFDAKVCELAVQAGPADPVAETETLLNLLSGTPLTIAVWWIAATTVRIVSAVLDPQIDYVEVTSLLFRSGTPVLAGFLAAAALGIRRNFAPVIHRLVVIDLILTVLYGIAQIVTPSPNNFWTCTLAFCVFSSVFVALQVGAFATGRRQVLAAGMVVATFASSYAFDYSNRWFWYASYQARQAMGVRDAAEEAEDSYQPIESDRLWGEQAKLMERQIDALREPLPRSSAPLGNAFAIVVAASGQQDIFAREAHAVTDAWTQYAGANSRGTILLSNGKSDLFQTPLATQDNFSASAKGIAANGDPKRDVIFVYLTSHGSKDAALQTDLPDYQTIRPLSATTVAKALKDAGLVRRVIVVSACYSGTWAKALASDDTILITASAKDRTSFGCDDQRSLTVFGEAFSGALRKPGLSLEAVFETAKARVSSEEKRLGASPSLPQVFVGRNMQTLWTAGNAAK